MYVPRSVRVARAFLLDDMDVAPSQTRVIWQAT